MRGMRLIRWIVVAGVLLAGHGYAADRNWIADEGGDFNAAGSWQDGLIPSASDTAIFGVGGDASYGVTFSSATTSVAELRIKNDDIVTFDLSGNTLNVTTSTRLIVGDGLPDASAGNATATFTNGTLNVNHTALARSSNHEATLNFGAGVNATLGHLFVSVGTRENTKGTLNVEDGAQVTMSDSVIRPQAGFDLIVTGNDSVLNVTSNANRRWFVHAGTDDGPCNITVSDGALFHAAGPLYIRAENSAGSGGHPVITVDNATMRTEGSLYIGEYNSTTLTLQNNAVYESGASLIAGWIQDNAAVQHEVYVNVESGSRLSVAANIGSYGSRTPGVSTTMITVTGEQSLIEAEGSFTVGGTVSSVDRTPVTLAVLDGGRVEVQNLLRIDRAGASDIDGSRLELGRGTITAGELEFRPAATWDTSRFDVTLFDALAGQTLVDVRKNVIGEDEEENPIYSSGNAILGSETAGAILSVQLDEDYSFSGEDVFTLLRIEGTRSGLFVDSDRVFIQDDDIVWEGTGAQEGWFARINYIDGDGGDPSFVTLTVIPEPGTGVFLLLAGAMGLRFWRRRRGC